MQPSGCGEARRRGAGRAANMQRAAFVWLQLIAKVTGQEPWLAAVGDASRTAANFEKPRVGSLRGAAVVLTWPARSTSWRLNT